MDIKKIIAELQHWQGEDEDNRGLIIIANECIAKSEGDVKCACVCDSQVGVVGPETLLNSAIKVALTRDKDLAYLIAQAAKEIARDIMHIHQTDKGTIS